MRDYKTRLIKIEKSIKKPLKRDAPAWMIEEAKTDPLMAELVRAYENPNSKKLEDYFK